MSELLPKILPSEKIMDVIAEYTGCLKTPAQKLKFINRVVESYSSQSKAHYRIIPGFEEIIVRRLSTKELSNFYQDKKSISEIKSIGKRPGLYKKFLWYLYPFRKPFFFLTVSLMFCLSAFGVYKAASLIPFSEFKKPAVENIVMPIETGELKGPVWIVEETPELEVYSNRLRIITTETTDNIPRRYIPFSEKTNTLPEAENTTDKIAGILYHSSESDILPLSEQMNAEIKRSSRLLLKYIKRIKSYNYFIDRYGRVYRVVPENHAAFHAGNSIWYDGQTAFLNLNHAFIGICFEGKDFEPQESGLEANTHTSINEVQVKSARELTDWLRYKYEIDEKNCVTHGLTSINPKNKYIGYHMDLAKGFPFSKMGLKDKYHIPLPSIELFGFSYDDYYLSVFKNQLNPGITKATENVRKKAVEIGISEEKYKEFLFAKFTLFNQWQWLIEKELSEKSAGTISDDNETSIKLTKTRQRLQNEFIQLTKPL